ncbi:hypothetical protein [Streptomyces cavernicola]|uniref:Gram-positive cocci surface proteins LPxTG domain-containing protein n=1 Tax=Streptomyces cavernicola TaxID=3043613 RepID=A0ABT6SM34_9ACTN|nr:hypothetical protein [Streptomyces sp. B-S-A6]MDI3409154.1 hypothetical protein [Streptomyces sp. B-S-A6]
MLSGAGLVLAASPAQAAETAYKTECVPPAISGMDPVHGTTKVEIKAPAEAKVGDEVEVVWKTTQAASKNPDVIDLQENTVKPSGTVKVAGGQTEDLAVEGERKNPPIKKGDPMVLSDMKGTLKLTAPGEITLTPDAYNINVSKPVSTDTKCTPEEDVKSAATIKVSGGGPGGGLPTGVPTGIPTGLPTGVPTGVPTGLPTGGAAGGGDAGGSDSGGSDSGGSDSGGSDTGGSSGGSTGGGSGQADFKGKEVQIPYECKTPIGDKEATSPVQIDAAKSGENFDLTVKFKKSVMDSPADIPKDSVKPSMEVELGGADKGTVHVEGPTNKEPIKSGDPIEIPDLKGTYKPGADGKSTLSPGVLTVKALGTTTTCTPARTEVSLELDTAAQPGGAAGGSGSGSAGGSAGGSSGGLAETGASDDGALRALGLVAGTVILLGGAVFTFMPRRLAFGGRRR